MQRLEGKVAVLTGAGSGIGRATAWMFAEQGARVVVTDLHESAAETVAQSIAEAGGRAIALRVDVGVEDELRQMIASTLKAFGRIDVLFNNAVNKNPATVRDVDFLDFNEELFHANMRVNVLGGVLACKHALPQMLEQGGGSIIFTSSTSSIAGEVAQFSYGASKAALNWYVQSIAATFGKRGVRCNAILPGVIRTPAMESWANSAMQAAFLDIQNVPRLGEPEDIAGMALYLASDESRYVNGALLRVDGGMSCTTPMVPVVRAYL
ncbi:2,5-dichloro-2,5-cyclohexadiene-1,4-diol dehydrogenase [compost metagenome]|uniref:Short-chain dehydrogenase/reductase SDR n=2 Tax=Metapseudomonas TaxID=3236656 RepID=A0AAD1C4P8_METFU|nr:MULTISPECIES: glucose 1-dehydrogenase [Pseudomonas]ELS27737.1 Short-chain dehydrogenase/reductase SDR [Pseudomonas furukawaii]MBT8767101.1 glucose 1-dehydrogenase [Pseudomonas boanensis]BAU75474.1 short-chain dehydrogenase/reductase SDR [Pseudomonas furukawaii]